MHRRATRPDPPLGAVDRDALRRRFPDRVTPPSIVPSVTEIPEHLLKRSQAAKAKADGADAPADAPAAVPATKIGRAHV